MRERQFLAVNSRSHQPNIGKHRTLIGTALNGSDPPCSNLASMAVRTVAIGRYSIHLRHSHLRTLYSMYHESVQAMLAKLNAHRALLYKQLGRLGIRNKTPR